MQKKIVKAAFIHIHKTKKNIQKKFFTKKSSHIVFISEITNKTISYKNSVHTNPIRRLYLFIYRM
jgi:hypothetical protein